MLRLPPLSLYVHMPWCVRKCPYCDFNSHAAPEQLPQPAYVQALLQDLEQELALVQGRALGSIFFGGGTPSLFDPEQIARLLEGVRARIAFEPSIEITLEANPGTIEHGRFEAYRDAGVNRISLGAQSFNEAHLRALGRIHGAADVARAVDELRQAGLDNFNLDLMYGLPAQTRAQALADVESAIALEPAHISYYQLTLEPGTVFYHRPPPLPEPDEIWEMQLQCQGRLAAHGYVQYEVSAYARAGRRSRHNLNYWRFGDYLGIGAGAHGKASCLPRPAEPSALADSANERPVETGSQDCSASPSSTPGRDSGGSDPARARAACPDHPDARGAGGCIVRTARVRQPREYLAKRGTERIAERRCVSLVDLPFEYMLNALRLVEGFEVADFETRTGLAYATIQPTIAAAERKGLLERVEAPRTPRAGVPTRPTGRGAADGQLRSAGSGASGSCGASVETMGTAAGQRWRATELGQRFLNDLQAMFLPSSE